MKKWVRELSSRKNSLMNFEGNVCTYFAYADCSLVCLHPSLFVSSSGAVEIVPIAWSKS